VVTLETGKVIHLHAVKVDWGEDVLLYPGGKRIVDVALRRGEARTSVRAWRWRFLILVITHHAEYMGVLLYTMKELQQGENSEDGNLPLTSA